MESPATSNHRSVFGSLCPICSGAIWEHVQRVRRASLSRCASCDLLATTDFLTEHQCTEKLYDVGPENHKEYKAQYLPARLVFFERILPKLERFRKSARLLEVGSGYGDFLECASIAAWDAQGVEISDYGCKIARTRGRKVYQADFLTARLIPGSYDIVAMWDVIEHFTDPAEVLRRCMQLLRPGGAIVLRTPDARALTLGVNPFRVAYRHLAYPANTPEHVFHFTPRDLSSLLTKLAFEAIEIEAQTPWAEFVVSGNNAVVCAGRRLFLMFACALRWPYEFVVTATKPCGALA